VNQQHRYPSGPVAGACFPSFESWSRRLSFVVKAHASRLATAKLVTIKRPRLRVPVSSGKKAAISKDTR
jgi:hypothetical protein